LVDSRLAVMLVTVTFAHQRAQPVQTAAERMGGGPCGPRFCTRRSRCGFGLRTRRTIGPASECSNSEELRANADSGLLPGDSWATRTRENAAVERRRARAPRPWGARRHTRCLACRQGTPRCGQFPHRAPTGALSPFFRGGRKRERPRRASSRAPPAGPAERWLRASGDVDPSVGGGPGWLFDTVKKRRPRCRSRAAPNRPEIRRIDLTQIAAQMSDVDL